MAYYIVLVLLAILIIAWDIKYKKIPNLFVVIALITIFVNGFIHNGMSSVWENLLSMLIGFIGMIILWGVIAAGDVKLLMVISMIVGVKIAWLIFITSTIIAMLFFVLKNPIKIKEKLKRTIYRYLYQIGVSKMQKTVVIAYSPFIMAALGLYLVVKGV